MLLRRPRGRRFFWREKPASAAPAPLTSSAPTATPTVTLAAGRAQRSGPAVGAEPAYCPQRGQRVYEGRRARCRPRRKLAKGGETCLFVRDHLLRLRWSPKQIAATVRLKLPDDQVARLSHKTIYAMIYAQPRGGLKAAMVEALRQGKTRRGTRRTTGAGSAIIPESLKIIHRPEGVDARLIPGHWPCGPSR